MKKVFLSIFTLLIGMSTVAMAQAPCKTVKECETLRINAHKLLTGKKASQAVHASLDQHVDKQIKDLPSLWPQGNIIQGVQWSGVLDDKYDNLDLDPKNFPVKNGIIQKSKATEACKAIGGRLPTKAEYKKLEADWEDESIVSAHFKKEMKDKRFWSSSAVSNFPCGAYFLFGNSGFVDSYGSRSFQGSVRCVWPLGVAFI